MAGSYEVGQAKGSLLCQYSAVAYDYLQSALQRGFDAVFNRVDVWGISNSSPYRKAQEKMLASCMLQP